MHDLSTFTAAVGAGLLIAAWTPSWRVPILAVATAQGALHLVNHLFDVGAADTRAAGIGNAVAIGISVAVLAWLLVLARREAFA